MAKPSWETKDDPDLPDLIETMLQDERQQYYALGSVSEREEFLAKIQERWRSYREVAKNRPASDSPHDTEDTFEALRRTNDEIKSGLLDLHRRLQTGELVENPTREPLVPISSIKKSKGASRHPILAALFAAIGTLILNELHVPLKFTIPFWVALGLCIWQWPRIVKTTLRQVAFWLTLILCSAFLVYLAFGQRQARSQQPGAANQPQSTAPTSDNRIFVAVDATYFATLYRTHSTAQADIAAQSYLGKWIKTAGEVGDVRRDQFLGSDSVYVTITIPAKDSLRMYVILAKFTQSPYKERVLILNRGEQINLIGKIDKADSMGLFLEECEFVP